MKYIFIFLIASALSISSCSPDPCEEITCVRGDCNNGICECPIGFAGEDCSFCADGFYGENCDVMSIAGSYWLHGMAFSDCDDYRPGYSVNSPMDMRELCVTEVDENIFCWSVNLTIDENSKTFEWIGAAIWSLNKGETWHQWTTINRKGAYLAREANLILISEEFRDYKFIIADNQLTRIYQKFSYDEDCFWREVFIRESN